MRHDVLRTGEFGEVWGGFFGGVFGVSFGEGFRGGFEEWWNVDVECVMVDI